MNGFQRVDFQFLLLNQVIIELHHIRILDLCYIPLSKCLPDNVKKKVLSIRGEDSMYKRICDYAGKHKMTVTEVVLQGLEKVLNRPE